MNPDINRELFDRLIVKNKGLVISTIRKNCMNRDDLDDYYQEALLNFYRHIHTYDPTRPLASWLIAIVKRLVRRSDYRRYAQRRVRLIDPVRLPAIAGDFTVSPDDPFYNELSPEITTAIENLKPIYRDAFMLQLSGLKLKEIAEVLYKSGRLRNKNIETVKSRIFLCKKKLREYLNRSNFHRQ